MKKKKKAALYARFSSDNQRTESIDAQKRAINAFCEKNDYEIVKQYVDEAKTATTDRRPCFQEMINDSEKGLFEAIIVHKLDRFARNRYDSAVYRRILKENGVKIISVIENFDGSPESSIFEAMSEAMAEYYSKNLAREVKKGQRETALKCKYTGGYVPYGFQINPETKKYEINESEAEIVRTIFQMYISKKGYTEILEKITLMGAKTRRGMPFTKNGIADLITNPKYIGVYCYNRKAPADDDRKRNSHKNNPNSEDIIWIENGVPAIIDKQTFDLAQKRKEQNAHGIRSKREKENYLLTGLIVCGECGHAFTGNRRFSGRNKKKYVTYRCTNHNKGEKCCCKEVNKDYLEDFILDLLLETVLSSKQEKALLQALQDYQVAADKEYFERIKRFRTEKRAKETEIENLLVQIDKGIATDIILKRIEQKQAEISQIDSNISDLESNAPKSIDKKAFSSLIKKARKAIKEKKAPQLREWLSVFIEKIQVNKDDITIVLTYNNIVSKTGGGDAWPPVSAYF